DGVALPPGALGVPYKVDPGHHAIVAKTDATEGRAEIDVRERETKGVVVRLVASAPVPTTSATTSATIAPPDVPPSRFSTVTWIGIGVAAAGVVAGTVTGVMSISKKGTLESECNGTRCPPSSNDTIKSASTLATVSTVSFVVAGVGAGV